MRLWAGIGMPSPESAIESVVKSCDGGCAGRVLAAVRGGLDRSGVWEGCARPGCCAVTRAQAVLRAARLAGQARASRRKARHYREKCSNNRSRNANAITKNAFEGVLMPTAVDTVRQQILPDREYQQYECGTQPDERVALMQVAATDELEDSREYERGENDRDDLNPNLHVRSRAAPIRGPSLRARRQTPAVAARRAKPVTP